LVKYVLLRAVLITSIQPVRPVRHGHVLSDWPPV